MTDEERAEWQERLQAAVAKTLRERAAKKAFRVDHLLRRKYGKAAYHRAKLARSKEKRTMTDTITAPLPWMPVIITTGDAETCALCPEELDPAFITIGAQDQGPVCEGCVNKLPDVGAPLWKLAEALDHIDSAMLDLPQHHRPGVAGVAQDMIAKILDWRIGPITPEQKVAYVAEMAEQDKMLRLPRGRLVKAAEYDPEKHGPFLP